MLKIKLSQLEMLVAVVDFGGFSAAATELDCTQSRISHAISELETSLGTRLLHRSRAGCTLTEAGHPVVAKARQMLHIGQSMMDSAQHLGSLAGKVRIACFRSAGTYLIPPALESLSREYPQIHVEVDDGFPDYLEIATHVKQGLADIGVIRMTADKGLISLPFVHDDYVLVLPSSVMITHPLDWNQLAHLPFIQLSAQGMQWVIEQCRANGFTNVPVRKQANESGIVGLVAEGLGFSILPRLSIFPEPPEVNVCSLPMTCQRNLAFILSADCRRDKTIETVLRFIRDKQLIRKTRPFKAGVISFDY
ncbi:LysR family transcriptional regulator [Pseudogulbenkiania ferrooxidans]|uniref:Transcriptional regulator, LysR family n=1 Tax=Pseudogulbenkiania ferrooxidans 2002 TaxID=279714 RepID=B9Z0P5_9NEIS|nr:LysR family transcriptional regulator [Pseudogulbenkiania ferrooxidans]EEG09651.1 transcriptional regulator, LysR family [Pseudogulbenkiania ferrooxidans 2002]